MVQKDTLHALVGYTAAKTAIQASSEIWAPVIIGLAAPLVVDFVVPYLRKIFKIKKDY